MLVDNEAGQVPTIAAAKIRTDAAILDLIPTPSEAEIALLEESVLAEGIRDALVVWDEEDILLDGHHRYELAKKHGLGYRVIRRSFPDRDAATEWVLQNQLGRRNLTDNQRAYLLGKLYEARKRREGRPEKRYQSDTVSGRTREELSNELAVSAAFVARSAEFARSVDSLAKIDPEIKRAALADEITQADVRKLAKVADEDPGLARRALHKARSGEAKSIGQAIARVKTEVAVEAGKSHSSRIKIVKMDAIEFLAGLDRKVDLLLTDPPYMTDVPDIRAFSASWLARALDTVKDTGRAYIFIGPYPEELLAYLLVADGYKRMRLANVMVWTYRNTVGPAPSHAYKNNWQAILYFHGLSAPPLECNELAEKFSVQDVPAPDGRIGERYHAWEKPLALAERLIRHSTTPGALVVDPFVGTGTFAIASRNTGREFIGCDVSDEMLAIAESRGLVISDAS